MKYCPYNDWGSNSAAAAALKLFRAVIKSWISYEASLKWALALPWYPSCSLYIIALCIEHSFYQASIHNLIWNLPRATLNWMVNFKIMFHHTINNGEYLPEKLEKPLCWKWPLTPVMTCLILTQRSRPAQACSGVFTSRTYVYESLSFFLVPSR